MIDLPGELTGDPEACAHPSPGCEEPCGRVVEAVAGVGDLADEPSVSAADADIPDTSAVRDRICRHLGGGEQHVTAPA
jgi:hypothetical protein